MLAIIRELNQVSVLHLGLLREHAGRDIRGGHSVEQHFDTFLERVHLLGVREQAIARLSKYRSNYSVHLLGVRQQRAFELIPRDIA